jgi:hypothetical protein
MLYGADGVPALKSVRGLVWAGVNGAGNPEDREKTGVATEVVIVAKFVTVSNPG